VRPDPECSRCGAVLRPPDVWSSAWRCEVHGEVVPLHPPVPADAERLTRVAERAGVPMWLPWPLPPGWLVAGVRTAGDARGRHRAVALACSGPGLLDGPTDLVVVAEEPGVGLGARYAGLDGPDPGASMTSTPADTKVDAAGHPTPLWSVPGADDRAAYVGEAGGLWLWLVAWPPAGWTVVHDGLRLVDLRAPGHGLDVPAGAMTPRLAG
jgi:Family of unknown function (DUF6758)